MEIKKEDLVKIRSFEDKIFYGIRLDIFDEPNPIEVEIVNEPEPVPVPLTEEEVKAIAKEKEIKELKAKLKELEV